MSKTRYIVEWTPWADVLAAATKAGMPPDGEVSDFVSIEDHDRQDREFASFADAEVHARSVIEADTWHCPRIIRQSLNTHDTDDLGNEVEPMTTWDDEATWEVFDDSPALDADKPDYLADAA
jgi:hypothetical protein